MTRKTKDQLSKSLYLLLQEYPFDNITVNQIINHSHISRTTFYRHFHNKQDVLTYFFHNDIYPQFFPSKTQDSYYTLAKQTILYSRKEKNFFKNALIDSQNTLIHLLINKYIQLMSTKLPKLTKTQYDVLSIYLNGTMITSIHWFLKDDEHSIPEMLYLFDLAMPDIIKSIFDKS